MNPDQAQRLFIMGDIHGWYEPFRTLLDVLDLRNGDLLITLGDYVDRGPENGKVIDTLKELWDAGLLLPLRGNHDKLMQESHRSQAHVNKWLMCDGGTTMMTYGCKNFGITEVRRKVPKKHLRFLKNACSDWAELEDFILVHGGVDPALPMDQQSAETLRWRRFERAHPHISGKLVCCGHSGVKEPTINNHTLCIDTRMGVDQDGKLTAVDLKSGYGAQTNRDSEWREFEIEIPGVHS